MGLIWSFFLAVFYPGMAMNDTIYIIENPWELGSQHPIIYNLYLYGCYRLGVLFKDANFGLFINSLVQSILMILVIDYGIMKLYERGRNNKALCYVLVVFYTFAPIYFIYSFWGIKDTVFSIALYYLCIELYLIAIGSNENLNVLWTTRMIFALLGIILFRNGGVIIAIIVVSCFWILRSDSFKKWIILIIIIGITFYFNKEITNNLVGDVYRSEYLGMQIQQVAATISYEEIDEEDLEIIYKICPKEVWINNYAPACADTIKWHPDFDKEELNKSHMDFSKEWIRLGLKYPVRYIKAWLLETYGFWGIETRNPEQYYEKNVYDNSIELYRDTKVPYLVYKLISKFYCNKYTLRYMSAGTSFLIIISLIIRLFAVGKRRLLIPLMPVVGLWSGLLAITPISFAFRYVFVVALIMPMIITMVITDYDDEKDRCDNR